MSSPTSLRVVPVVMAGGSGTRLWPLSRAGYPKQFLVLSGTDSLFQQAVRRLVAMQEEGLAVGAPLVVGNDEHRFLLQEQLRETGIEGSTLLLEPVGRNTAPALTLAALQALQDDADPVLVVAAADQTVTDPAAFTAACRQAARLAAGGGVVVLGIRPDRPETGYGYIQAAEGQPGAEVLRFVEKPDRATAEGYVASGGFFWNSGMFVLRASVWIDALRRFRPDIEAATRAAFDARRPDAAFVRPGREAFAAVPAESVDYAVMERCPGSGIPVRMVPLDCGWNDLGAWDAVWQVAGNDGDGNAANWIVVRGTAEVTCGDKVLLLTENQSTYIPLGEKHRLANPGKVPLEIVEVQSGSYLGEDDIVRFEDGYGRG